MILWCDVTKYLVYIVLHDVTNPAGHIKAKNMSSLFIMGGYPLSNTQHAILANIFPSSKCNEIVYKRHSGCHNIKYYNAIRNINNMKIIDLCY